MADPHSSILDQILDLLPVPEVLTGVEVKRMRRPVVYVLRDAGGAPLYVGVGCNGLIRPLGWSHHAVGDALLKDTDRLELFYCKTILEALELEVILIDKLRPQRNKVNAKTGRFEDSSRYLARYAKRDKCVAKR
jgi:hypothetical protein